MAKKAEVKESIEDTPTAVLMEQPRVFSVRIGPCPRELVEAPTAEAAVALYRLKYGLRSELRTDVKDVTDGGDR